MATIRKRGSRYNVQIRKEGYPSVTKTFTRISVAKKWASSIEADMERRIHVEVPDQTTVGELLKRYQRQISPSHKGQQVEAYRLGTLKKRLGSIRLIHLTPVTDGDRTFAEWSADFDSNQEKEVSKILSQDFFQSGLDSLRVGFLNT